MVASAELSISFFEIRNVLPEKLKVFSYNMLFLQQLFLEYYPLRLHCLRIIRRELINDSAYLKILFFPDECIFHTSRIHSKPKARIWDVQNLLFVLQVLVLS